MLAISFSDQEDMLNFAADHLGPDVSLYRMDTLDKEFRGTARHAIVRKRGAKPATMLIKREVRK